MVCECTCVLHESHRNSFNAISLFLGSFFSFSFFFTILRYGDDIMYPRSFKCCCARTQTLECVYSQYCAHTTTFISSRLNHFVHNRFEFKQWYEYPFSTFIARRVHVLLYRNDNRHQSTTTKTNIGTIAYTERRLRWAWSAIVRGMNTVDLRMWRVSQSRQDLQSAVDIRSAAFGYWF